MWFCYLGNTARPPLYFYGRSYFIPWHSSTNSLLKICTTISPYEKVSITTVILPLPSCKEQLLLPLERKQTFFQMNYI